MITDHNCVLRCHTIEVKKNKDTMIKVGIVTCLVDDCDIEMDCPIKEHVHG